MSDAAPGIKIDEDMRLELLIYLHLTDADRFYNILKHATTIKGIGDVPAWRYEQMASWMTTEFGVRVRAKSKDGAYWMETDNDHDILILKLGIL